MAEDSVRQVLIRIAATVASALILGALGYDYFTSRTRDPEMPVAGDLESSSGHTEEPPALPGFVAVDTPSLDAGLIKVSYDNCDATDRIFLPIIELDDAVTKHACPSPARIPLKPGDYTLKLSRGSTNEPLLRGQTSDQSLLFNIQPTEIIEVWCGKLPRDGWQRFKNSWAGRIAFTA